MTVFDRLEAQLLDAHPHRARRALPRPAPRRVLAFAAGAAAVAAIVFAALWGGSSTSSRTSAGQPGGSAPAVAAGKTVAVLNASRTPGLARDAATELARHGWKITKVTNAPDQSRTSSVYFNSGHARDGKIVAGQLGIPDLMPCTPSILAVAGTDADVIVVVGADRVR
jgi:LytR cell envelope-related transcriptional attenuator